jgi:1-acyl-sn-glycerol-3-phosphate acyltransferase
MALLRMLFVALVAYPVVLVMLGLNVRHRARLPRDGPAIIAANHNSHLDTLVLFTLFPLLRIPRIRPVAAADYFLANRFVAWFSLNVIGIIPIERKRGQANSDPLAECYAALERGEILLIFPEGSRGEPEQMTRLKSGIAHLAARFPAVPVVPVFMHGLGKSMPRGEWLLVPFFCDVFVGLPLRWQGERKLFMDGLQQSLHVLKEKLVAPERI